MSASTAFALLDQKIAVRTERSPFTDPHHLDGTARVALAFAFRPLDIAYLDLGVLALLKSLIICAADRSAAIRVVLWETKANNDRARRTRLPAPANPGYATVRTKADPWLNRHPNFAFRLKAVGSVANEVTWMNCARTSYGTIRSGICRRCAKQTPKSRHDKQYPQDHLRQTAVYATASMTALRRRRHALPRSSRSGAVQD